MKLTLLEVTVCGETCYLVNPSCLAHPSTTTDIMQAKNYEGKPDELERDLAGLKVPGDEIYARSGLAIEALPMLVEIEVTFTEKRREVARTAYTSN